MTQLRFFVLVPLLFLASCTHPAPITTVELIDTSLSISPRAEQSALDAVGVQIQRMGRGDRLILIPITGNAVNDAGGRILRLQTPTVRTPYDADLRRFRESAGKQFATWAAAHGAERHRTDLLGSLDVARQELASLPVGSARRLIILSDFLEDDGAYNFLSDSSLDNAFQARRLATRLRSLHRFALQGTPACLGRLASVDYEHLSTERIAAIDAFWETYLADDGHAPDIEIDGVGILKSADGPCLKAPGMNDRKRGNAP